MKNNYGNYVVQKALKLSTGNLKSKLMTIILRNIEKIGDKKLMMKWRSIVNTHINFKNLSNTLENQENSSSKKIQNNHKASSKKTNEIISPENDYKDLNMSFNTLSLEQMIYELTTDIPKKKNSCLITKKNY